MTYSTVNYLEKRTGKWGTPRPEYLQQLVTEFSDTTDHGKHQEGCFSNKTSNKN
jgi:hypothetical protein